MRMRAFVDGAKTKRFSSRGEQIRCEQGKKWVCEDYRISGTAVQKLIFAKPVIE